MPTAHPEAFQEKPDQTENVWFTKILSNPFFFSWLEIDVSPAIAGINYES